MRLLKESNYLIFNKLTTAYGYNTGRWGFVGIDSDKIEAESYLNPIKAFNEYSQHQDLILKGLLLNNYIINEADYSELKTILKTKQKLGVEFEVL